MTDSSFITNMGFSAVAASLGSQPMLDLTVDQYLWGYEDKLVTVANQFLPNWIDFGSFGLLERVKINFINHSVDLSLAKYKRLIT